MKASSPKKSRSKSATNSLESEPCVEPGHCPPDDPPDDPPAKPHQAMPPRLTRRVPPEAERRAFEDAVNGWWWL